MRKCSRSLISAILFLVLSQSGLGQTVTSSLSGDVTDITGAVIAGANVVLTDEAARTKYTTTSNASGHFSFAAILPGAYTVTVSAKGFAGWQEKGITINQN